MKMFKYIYLSGALIACLIWTSLGDTTTYFECYKDRCARGRQYCVQAQERCYHCEDIKQHCGTRTMPRDCDSYCVGLDLKDVKSRLNIALKEKESLQRAAEHLQMSLENSTHITDILKEENKLLNESVNDNVNKLSLAETNLNESQINYMDLDNRYKGLEIRYQDKSVDHMLIIITVLAICLTGIFGILFGMEKIKFRRRKRNLGEKYKEPTMTEAKKEEESIGLIKQETFDGISRASTGDSAVDIETDDDNNETKNCQETIVNESETASGVRRVDGNCLRKNTPAALKGIQPSRNSVDDLSPKVCVN